MIWLEILFFVGVISAIIYFAFFSKTIQRLARGAEKRNEEITAPDTPAPESADAIAASVQDIERQKQATATALATRKAAVAEEADKLGKISVN